MLRVFSRAFGALCFLVSAGLFAAAPTIKSFTPTSGTVGTSVVLTGTNFTGATAVKFNGTAASSYKVNSATKITAAAPTGVTTGKITVTTTGGTATSATSFTVASAPTITTQPASKTVNLGSTATFSIVASGTAPLSYQWSKNGTVITGATSASYTTPSTVTSDNGATFTVKVSNTGGSVTSNAATLTLNVSPTLSAQPANQNVFVGSMATFSVVANGTAPLTYQWSKNGTVISGAISASYTTPATVLGDNASTFTVDVANSYGSITSSPATLTVMVMPPSIITPPASQTVALGSSATFSLVAGGTGPLTYQWSKNGTAIPGATSASYTTPAIVATDNGAIFTVSVTNAAGGVNSSASLTLGLPPTITSQPYGPYILVGSTAGFWVGASGTGPLTYQWSKNGAAISGATSNSYTTPATVIGDNGSTFTVQVSNSYGNVTSSSAKLTVYIQSPSITTPPANQTVALGATATFTVAASGSDPLTYQWSKNGTAIPGATSAFYTTPPTVSGDGGSNYSVTIRNDGGSVTSSTVGLFLQTPAVQVIPSRTTVSFGKIKQFQALVQSGSVTWSVVEANGGVISQIGAYQAPNISGTYTIKAISTIDSSLFGVAKVVVNATGSQSGPQPGSPITGNPGATGVSLTLTPGNLTVDAGTAYPFSVHVTGTDNQAVNWQVVGNPTDAKVDLGGVFQAQRQGLYQVQAVSVADPTAAVVAQVDVQSALHSSTDNPLTALRGYSVTGLPNGKLLIAGGATSADSQIFTSDQISSQAYLYDPTTQLFTLTGSMLIGRTDHKATLLPDGRVLITSGLGVRLNFWDLIVAQTNGPTPPHLEEVDQAEIYDPNLAAFVSLPSPGTIPSGNTSIPLPNGYSTDACGPWMSAYLWADTMCLPNGDTILLPGANNYWHNYWVSGGFFGATQFYTAAMGTFDLQFNHFGYPHPGLERYNWTNTNQWGMIFNPTSPPKCGVGVVLNDGRAIAIGGFDCVPELNEQNLDWYGSSGVGSALGAWNSVNVFNPVALGWSSLASMNVSRARHTATKLTDGRVLIVGGGTGVSPDPYARVEFIAGHDPNWIEMPLVDTPTAEIFDPATNSWTMVGSLSQSRQGHAATLLADGRVMVLGGRHYVQGGYPNATYTYPNDVEIFDPATNTWSVMDHLDYGLSEPKLALLQDGSVFVAGQTQAPMEPPIAQQLQSNGLKMMAAADLAGNTLTSGSTLMGVISSSWNVIACPEEASLKYDKVAKVLAPEIGDTWHEGLVPKKATISVPMAGGVNEEDRYFILKIKKPSPNFSITGFAVTLKAGNQNQVVNGPISADYSQLFSRSDVTYYHGLPAPPGDPTDEAEREYLRKQWLQAWLPASTPSDHVTEFYKVRVTMKTNAPSAIQYGVNGQLPPSDTLSYEFKIYYTLNGVPGQPFTLPPWSVPTVIQAHWDASQLFQGQSYGTRNNDQWCDLSTFSWVSDPGKRGLLEPVNDISLEHGRNTGHSYSHLDGRQADMYHPAYTTFIGSVSNTSGTQFRDTQLIPTLQRARGWVERDANYQPIRTVQSDPDAVRTLAQWIRNARVKIRDFMSVDTVGPFGLNSFIYMSTAGDGYPQFVAEAQQLRDLMLTGACTSLSAPWTDGTTSGSIWYSDLNLTNNPAIQPESDRPQPWGVDDKQWIGDTTPQGVHTNHLHLQWGTKSKKFLN